MPGTACIEQKIVDKDDITECRRSALDHISKFVGDKVAIIAARYQYWGIVSEILTDGVVLANAVSVEASGASSLDVPERTDPINGSVLIMIDAVEIVYQPNWSRGPLPGEEGYGKKKSR